LHHVGIGTVRTPTVLADQIHDAPADVPLLNVFERERRHFGTAQPTAEEHG
jgi:hypothetical protein